AARARQPHDEDRRDDTLFRDLAMPLAVFHEAQSVHEEIGQVPAGGDAAHQREVRFVFEAGEKALEGVAEVGVAEVVETARPTGGVQQIALLEGNERHACDAQYPSQSVGRMDARAYDVRPHLRPPPCRCPRNASSSHRGSRRCPVSRRSTVAGGKNDERRVERPLVNEAARSVTYRAGIDEVARSTVYRDSERVA